MAELSDFDHAFIEKMIEIALAKAEFLRRREDPNRDPERDAQTLAGLQQVRKARRMAIARYRELRDVARFL